MNLESGEIEGTEFPHGLTPIETIVAIETLIDEPLYSGKSVNNKINLLCNNCGYKGVPFADYIERSGKRKSIPVCPVCGERSWAKLVQLIAKIRKILELCKTEVIGNDEYCDSNVDNALEGLV